MKLRKKLIPFLVLTACLVLFCSMPVFAAELQALSEGCPVISSQRAGLFTSGGHFIVLRGVTANGKVLVNDPNDSDAKNYINREFDMMSEIHATANAYWIFDKK